ncbi:hypothetical protein ACHAXS_001008, partial [Conticribra weissflogii]
TSIPTLNPTTFLQPTSRSPFIILSSLDVMCDVPDSAGNFQECHGFEIEIHDLSCGDVLSVFEFNRYGSPSMLSNDNLFSPGCIVRYESLFESNQWLATTPVSQVLLDGDLVTPLIGDLCYSSGHSGYDTSGCEHFGVEISADVPPTSVSYRWLVEDAGNPGILVASDSRVGFLDVHWSTRQDGVNALVVGEPSSNSGCLCGVCCEEFGDPKWVKSCVVDVSYEVYLSDLISDNPEVPQGADQCEWRFVQAPPTCDEDCAPKSKTGRSVSLDFVPDTDTVSLVRRFEFYEFTGVFTDWNEADPKNEDDPLPEELGDYTGAHISAVVW